MYTQGNHNPQPGQGLQKPMSSPYPHCLPGPPLPPPQFQQSSSVFTSYQPASTAPHQNPPGGLPNTGPSYLPPAVHVHAGAPLSHMYPATQQNSQHHSHLGTQNAHNMPRPVLPPPISASQSQPPFRALPPPPPLPQSQGQTFYRAPVNPPFQRPELQHISSSPQIPPATSLFSINSTVGDHHALLTAPPPPPILPSPSPSTSITFSSSRSVQNAPNLPCNLESDGSRLSASGSMDGVVAPNQVKHNLNAENGSLDMGAGIDSNKGSLVGDKLSLQEGLTVDLSSTPPKPTDQKVIERIEALCLEIAKNGPDFEDMVRKNESGKPEYSFLFGDEPGSEAAIAHDFFQWMKKKSILACKLDEQHGGSSLRPSENESADQPYHSVIAAASYAPDDSDMEMEDDITQIDDEQGMNHSREGLNGQCDIRDSMLNVDGSSRLGKQGPEGITHTDQMAFETSVSKVELVKLTLPTELPSLVSSLEKSNTSSQLAKGGSPFRLLQDYASDDNSEKDVETGAANTEVLFGAKLGRDAGSSLENTGSPCQPEKGIEPPSLSSIPCAVASSEGVEGSITTSITKENKQTDNEQVHQVSTKNTSSGEVLQKESAMVDACVGFSKEHRQEEGNMTLGYLHEVDKFGRLVRNGASDSDSDGLPYNGRHRSGRTRSRSHSRSPPDKRIRRSPRRRRKKRSLSRSRSPRHRRSRSRSPRNRRSRSRSPRYRRSRSRSPRSRRSRSRSPRSRRSRSRSPRNRRSWSRSPRNRRSRSTSPHFRHGDEFSGESRRRVKGHVPFCFDFRRGRCYRGVSCRYLHHDSGMSDESRQQRINHSSRTKVPEEIKQISERVGDHEHGEVRGPEVQPYGDVGASTERNTNQKRDDSVGAGAYNQDSHSTEYHMIKSGESRDIPAAVFETHLVENKQEVSNLVTNENCREAELHNHSSHIASSSFPCSHDIGNPHIRQQQTASSIINSSEENFPGYMLPNQQSFFALQPNSSLASLPPPPLPPQDSIVKPGVSSHFQQSHLPLRNDFGSQIIPRPYSTELPAHSQSDGFQQRAYLSNHEANRPFLHASLLACNLPVQQFGAPNMLGDNGLTQPLMQNVIAPNSFAQGNTHPHTVPFSQQLLGNKMQPFPSEGLPPGELSNSSSYVHPYSQQQQPPPQSLHHLMVDHVCNLPRKMNSSLKDPPDIRDATSHCVDVGGSTSSSFPYPYASNSSQPINSKYSYNIMQEKYNTYNNTPFCLTHTPVDGRGIGLQQATSAPTSDEAVGESYPRSGGDQYDPLFDSIEPSTRLSRKFDYIQKLEATGDSDTLLGLKGSNKQLDMDENNKRKDAGAVASAASADNEEFGETADAEGGAVENGSPGNPAQVNMVTNEVEIDQINSPGKSKKSKESRSMKLFKVALADFVKEVLKPSWQQGNMSKEAFKTIVKKTVDKVSGAMKSHQIPKSRAKIDHYIESSQRKLTKLVMGYVDKYVKV